MSSSNRSAVTSGNQLLPGHVDGRSKATRRFRDLERLYSDDLGGVRSLTEAQRTSVRSAAMQTVKMEIMAAKVLNGEEVSETELTRTTNALARALKSLGVEKGKAAPAKRTLADVMAKHAPVAAA